MFRITKLIVSTSLILALGAVASTAALAAEFHSEVSHTFLEGEQHAGEDTLTFNAGTYRCNKISYSGSRSGVTGTEVQLNAIYEECKAFGFINAIIDTNGCSFIFHIVTGGTTISCPAGQTITTTAFNCWITTGPQGPLTSITYTNNGSGSSRDVTVDINMSGLKYTQHSKSFPGCSSGTFSNGTYTGSLTLRGVNTASGQVGIWIQ